MKIQIVSDLHLEFGPITIENAGKTEVLILSGDICVAKDLLVNGDTSMVEHGKSDRYHTFFQQCCANFPHVLYVMGNHEHYHGDYATSITTLRENLSYLPNLIILDKESKVIEDVCFVGGTLWTDMNKEDETTMSKIKNFMNDYRIIKNSNQQVSFSTPIYKDNVVVSKEFHTRDAIFSPQASVDDHKKMLSVITKTLEPSLGHEKVVVVGHHAPSKISTKPQYEEDVMVNGAYSSDLTELMLDNPQIKLWTHGHTHHNFDYMVGSTRVVCNPRGYFRYEENEEFDPLKVYEV